jgi:outer membrane protein assembly factor BamB
VPLSIGRLTAHRISDGEVMWTRELTATKPLASDDRHVYVPSGDGLQALDANTGEVAWQLTPGGKLTAPPLAHAGWVLAAAAGELIAVRASDGSVVWRKPLGAIEFKPGLDGDLLVVPLIEGRVVALDVRNGTERWSRQLFSSPGEPLAIGGRVYVGTQNKRFYSLYANSGRVEFPKLVGAIPAGRAAVDERHIYFTALDNMIYALSRRTGTVLWRKGLPYRPTAGPVLIGTAVLVPGYVDIPLKAFDATTGSEVGVVAFAATLNALPLFTQLPDGTAVVIGVTGSLEEKNMVSMLAPQVIPDIPLQPLTVVPGEAVPLPQIPVWR